MLDQPERVLTGIEELRKDIGLLVYDEKCAEEFGKLRRILKRQGIAVNPLDVLIASVARVHNLTLVTNNTADFQNIPGLRREDWRTR